MPLWAWIGLAGLIGYFGFRLARTLRTGAEKYGIWEYDRASDPFQFWFFLSIDLVGLAFLLVLLLLVLNPQSP